MKYFFSDLRDSISRDNPDVKNRRFMRFMVAVSIMMLVIGIFSFVCALLGVVPASARVLSFAALPVVVVLVIGIFAVISKAG